MNAINNGDIGIDITDYSNVYEIESVYMDLETCPKWQHALYVQVRHLNPKNKKDWFYKTKSKVKKDAFYLIFNRLRNIEEKIGKSRADIKTCMENAYVDRMDIVGEDDSDFTKVISEVYC